MYSVYFKGNGLEPFSMDPFGTWVVGFYGLDVCVQASRARDVFMCTSMLCLMYIITSV